MKKIVIVLCLCLLCGCSKQPKGVSLNEYKDLDAAQTYEKVIENMNEDIYYFKAVGEDKLDEYSSNSETEALKQDGKIMMTGKSYQNDIPQMFALKDNQQYYLNATYETEDYQLQESPALENEEKLFKTKYVGETLIGDQSRTDNDDGMTLHFSLEKYLDETQTTDIIDYSVHIGKNGYIDWIEEFAYDSESMVFKKYHTYTQFKDFNEKDELDVDGYIQQMKELEGTKPKQAEE